MRATLPLMMHHSSVRRGGLIKAPRVIAPVIFLVSVVIHLPFTLLDCFGEQDAARIAIDALHSFYKGRFVEGSPRGFSCPLYMHGLYIALRSEWLSPQTLALAMALMSLVGSALCSAALFGFFVKVTRSISVGLAVAVIIQFSPVFWYSSLYGFPTIVALALFIVSALVFVYAVANTDPLNKRACFFAATWVIFTIATLIKIDVIMASALFLVPVFQASINTTKKLLLSAGVLLSVMLSFWFFNRYAANLMGSSDQATDWQNWITSFYAGLGYLFSMKNVTIIGRSIGIFTLPVATIALMLLLREKSKRPIALFTLLAFVPIMVFWGLFHGNSARHNLIPSALAPCLIALPLGISRNRLRRAWHIVILCLILLNYFSFAPSSSTVKPSGRLIESSQKMARRGERLTQSARAISRLPHNKILIITRSHVLPHYIFEILAADHLSYIRKRGGKFWMLEGAREKLFYLPSLPHAKRHNLAKKLRKEGFFVVHTRW
ncbi:MAG: hypothetical protein QNJ97_15215 [Myxococcota bacterium]|nr:hypothetical protein [Myxococcota bacterium]